MAALFASWLDGAWLQSVRQMLQMMPCSVWLLPDSAARWMTIRNNAAAAHWHRYAVCSGRVCLHALAIEWNMHLHCKLHIAACGSLQEDHFSQAFCMMRCQQPGAMQEGSKHLTSMYLHLIHHDQRNTPHGEIVSMHMPSRECTCTASCSPKGST